jgi:recombination associated protein RdgC
MGLSSGSVSFCRYLINGAFASAVDDDLLEKVNEHAFGRHGIVTSDGIETGWIGPGHLFDSTITYEKVAVGRYLVLTLRMDRNSVPAAVLKSYLRMEEEAALEAEGRETLTKQQRRQAKDAAMLRAEKEAKAGAFRRMASYPLFIDLKSHILYFTQLGSAANDKLYNLFRDTFDTSLTSLTAERNAHRLVGDNGRRTLEDARPVHLIEAGGNGHGSPGDMNFLGREFLSWVWFRSEENQGRFSLKSGVDAEVAMTRFLQLDCDFEATGSALIRRDGPASAPEARVGLTVGKQPVKAGLILASRGDEWSLSLDGASMTVSGMTVPPSDEADVVGRLEDRLDRIVEAGDVLDGVYQLFLEERTGGGWPNVLAEMRHWAQSQGKIRVVKGDLLGV